MEDLFLSFLFNLLENSYNVRQNTEDLIIFGDASDWPNYSKAMGGLFNDLAYFEYDVIAAGTDGVYMQPETDSPQVTASMS